jgi:hypothetical protein
MAVHTSGGAAPPVASPSPTPPATSVIPIVPTTERRGLLGHLQFLPYATEMTRALQLYQSLRPRSAAGV